jgi:multidrug transporter EmrE-like cation transporter
MGLLAVAVQVLRGHERLSWRHVGAGVALGVPNYASILFLLLALRELPGLVFYPLNNIGILVASSLAGVLYFREPFPVSSWVGLGLAVLAIAVLAWGS